MTIKLLKPLYITKHSNKNTTLEPKIYFILKITLIKNLKAKKNTRLRGFRKMLLIVLKMRISVISRGIKLKRMFQLNLITMGQCPGIRARLAVS